MIDGIATINAYAGNPCDWYPFNGYPVLNEAFTYLSEIIEQLSN
jgi:hypothetical protein